MQYVYTKTYNFLFLSNFQDQCGLIEKYLIQLRLRTTNSLRRSFQRLFWPWMNATFAINDSFLYGYNLRYKNSSFLLKKKMNWLIAFLLLPFLITSLSCLQFEDAIFWKDFCLGLSTWSHGWSYSSYCKHFSLTCFLLVVTLHEITFDKVLTSGAKISFDR